MTRKDYVLLSDTIRAHSAARKPRGPQSFAIAGETIQELSLAIGLALESDNPNFDLKRFLLACEGAA